MATVHPGTPTLHASGSFTVQVKPVSNPQDPTLGSYSLDKQYSGDLEATAQGQMLSAGDPASGNAGYVALERVSGSLQGKSGTFALMQTGTMLAGAAPQLQVTVVPGSGTGELSGITGTMLIHITGSSHQYTLDYQLTHP